MARRVKRERERRKCGCTEFSPCVTHEGACYWVERDLCSACATRAQRAAALGRRSTVRKSR